MYSMTLPTSMAAPVIARSGGGEYLQRGIPDSDGAYDKNYWLAFGEKRAWDKNELRTLRKRLPLCARKT